MADETKGKGTDQGTETRTTEIDEVKSFSGGAVKSVEPEAEVTEHVHRYSGGDIIERTDTRITPWYWGVVIVSLVVVIAGILFFLLPGFFNPAMKGVSGRANDFGGTLVVGQPGLGNYNQLSGQMQNQMTYSVLTSPTYINMYRLPLPAGQNLNQAISAGTEVYQTYCIGCHGPNQDGNGPNSVSLDPKPRNLRDVPFLQAMSYQRIWTSVHKGVPGTAMPRWENTLNDNQIEDVISYVFSLTAPQDSNHNFIQPSASEIAGAAMPASGNPPIAGNGFGTGSEAAHGAVGNLAPQARAPQGVSVKQILKAPISGPPPHQKG
jgi:mono/diheme cytochrome c family protein